jgi:integrase
MTEAELDLGVYVDRSEAHKVTLGELIDRYSEEVSVTKRGVTQERFALRILKRWFGPIAAARLSAKDIARFRDERLAAGKATTTVRKELAILSHLIDTAMKEWALPLTANPAHLVRKPPPRRGRDRRLSASELQRLNEAASLTPLMQPLVITATETGMRLGELLSLRWHDVDLARRIATLHETKNGDCRRVPLSSTAIGALTSLPRRLGDDRVFYPWKDANSFQHAWQRLTKRAQIQDFHFHDLRHEATSRLFERGLGIMEVAAITGHKTLQVLRRYTHLKPEALALKLG